jgi:hypothetical protein
MRTCAILILATLQATAQSETNTFTFDANGRRVLESTQSGGAQSIRSINGRIAPLEKVEEKILSDDANGKVTERIIRPYDPTGNPGPAQKIRITERKNADGSLATETQVFNANINGSFALTEKSEALTKTSGNQTTTEMQIARPTLNGGLSTVERTPPSPRTATTKTPTPSFTAATTTAASTTPSAKSSKPKNATAAPSKTRRPIYKANSRRKPSLKPPNAPTAPNPSRSTSMASPPPAARTARSQCSANSN